MSGEIWVVIPAYNEEKAISSVLGQLARTPYSVVVVDDGSSDTTSQVVLNYPVVLLRHITNLGQGGAIQTGIRYALSQPSCRYIVTFDSDGQHHAKDIPRLIAALDGGKYQVALGSRFMEGGVAEEIDPYKRLILKLAILFTRLTTRLELTDTHNGLRAFTKAAAQSIKITQNGMTHASEILSQIADQKIPYCEVPVTITYSAYSRAKGQSIWNSVNIIWDIFTRKIR